MYKKIFSAILFGVLTIASTSTFVSCKDYDDDIKYLQEQINELNNKKIAEINSTITDLKNADANLQKAIDDAKTELKKDISDGDAATLAAAKSLIEKAIEDCQKACKENLAKSQQEQDAKYDEAIAKVNQRVDDVVALLKDQEGNIVEVGKQLQALSNKLSTFESEFGTLSTAFRDVTKRVTNLEDAVKAQQAAIEKLTKEINGTDGNPGTAIDPSLKQEIEKAGSRINDLENKVKDLQSKLDNKFKEVMDKIGDVNGTVAQNLAELKAAHATFATKTDLENLSNEVAGVRAEAQALATEVRGLDVMLALLAQDLRSLVLMPKLYVDGIETIEYPYLMYALLDITPKYNITRSERDVYPRAVQLRDIQDFQDRTLNDSVFYGPVWQVDYHMNPGNADVVWEDILGYYAYNAEVISTRGIFDEHPVTNKNVTFGITSPEKFDNYYNTNDLAWKNANGILTAGIQIKNVNLIDRYGNPATGTATFPGDVAESTNSAKNVIVALQVKSTVNGGETKKDTVITSDYAQLLPEKIKIEGLIWNAHPDYWDKDNDRIKDFWENKKGYGPAHAQSPTVHPQTGLPNTYGAQNPAGWDYGYRKGDQNRTMGRDTICPVNKNWCHVWATPEEALLHPADIELYVHNRSGIKLIQYLGVHYFWEQNPPLTENVRAHAGVKTWKYDAIELRRLGLVWEFDTLDYFVDRNQTHDSRYITIDHADGTIIAQNVKESGATYEDETATAVGREPLVRVRLYHINNGKDKPVLDGYIRVHITQPELLEVDKYPAWNVTFDLCNDARTQTTTWAQFSKWVLTDELNNMEKEQFDANYQGDYTGALLGTDKEMTQYSKPRSTTSENKFYGYKQLNDLAAGVKPTVNDKIGHIYEVYDPVGTTNHTYFWTITAEEMEALTHDQATWDNVVTIDRYVHYTGHFYSTALPNNGGAKYDDIFIRLTLKIKRAEVPASVTSKRDENYWYNEFGSWRRFENPLFDKKATETTDVDRLHSVAWNTPYPQDGLGNTSRTVPWRNNILSAWDGNKVNVTNATGGSKFYFAPFEYEIKALDGTVYIVTPRRGSGDNIFNQFICKYWNEKHAYQLDQANPFNSAKLEENNKIFQKCAIAYQPSIEGIKANYNMNVAAIADYSAWPKADGVFSNDTLYAVTKAAYSTAQEYEPIAIITNTNTQNGGHVVLLHEYVQNKWLNTDAQPSGNKYTQANEWDKENAYAEACVNAVGYVTVIDRDADGLMTGKFEDHGNPLEKQLRSYVGVIATSKCNIANQMNDQRTKNFTVFQMPWERPINLLQENDFVIDAKTNADYIYIVDLVKLFDWRGVNEGHMWGDTPNYWGRTDWYKHQWLWAYYNVKNIKVDLRTNKVMTNLSDAGQDGRKNSFKALSTVSNMVQLTAKGVAGLVEFKFPDFGADANFPLRTSPRDYNAVSENQELIEYMGLDNAEMETLDPEKAQFGYIKYENNGDNVHDFEVKVPFTIVYDWGEIFDQPITIHIHYTRGN
jgi:peptidoglycan hydrolase CwlO-like protein